MQAVNHIIATCHADSELAEFLFEILRAEWLAGNIKRNRTRAYGNVILFDFELKQPIYRVAR